MNISGYKIEERIGQGGMAIVYRAIQESLARPVALKLLNPLFAQSAEFSKRFVNEGRMLASLRHSNVITIYDIGVQDPWHFISMEFVEGGDLKTRMLKGISVDTALDYLRTIAGGLGAAHDNGIVHRDIKPANVLFRADGTLLLTDFGIAKQLGEKSNLTLTGALIGSPHYLSPEQARGQAVDRRSDIYSLGILLYEMLVGEKPYVGDSDIDTAMRHISGPLPRLPPHLERYQTLLDRMIAKSPDERFEHTNALIECIDSVRHSTPNRLVLPEEVDPPSLAATATQSRAGDTIALETPAGTPAERLRDETMTILPKKHGEARTSMTPSRIKRSVLLVLAAGAVVLTGMGIGALILELPDAPETRQLVGNGEATTLTPHDGSNQKPSAHADDAQPVATHPTEATASAPETLTELVTQVPQDHSTAIPPLLASAREALEKYHLTTPPDDNAFTYYRKVLEIDPANEEAKSGFARIAERYAELARAEMTKGNYEGARGHVANGLRVDPGNASLIGLETEIQRVPPPDAAATVKKRSAELMRGIKNFFD